MNAKQAALYFTRHDPRNIVGSTNLSPEKEEELGRYSPELAEFYRHSNPTYVEVVSPQYGRILMCRFEDLEQWADEYGKTEHLIVASRDGDPIGVLGGKVYLGTHGAGGYHFVEIAASWMGFIAELFLA